MQHWNQLPADVLGTLPCKTIIFKKKVRKVITEVSYRKMKCVGNHLKVEGSEEELNENHPKV